MTDAPARKGRIPDPVDMAARQAEYLPADDL
jgi:hypothetical protein